MKAGQKFLLGAVAIVAAVGFMIALSVLSLPWTLYVGYFREHQYAMSNHTIGGFLREWLIGTLLAVAFVGLAISGIYRLLRRVRERWVLWATGVTFLLILFVYLVNPVFVAPLFNEYHPLPPGEVRLADYHGYEHLR